MVTFPAPERVVPETPQGEAPWYSRPFVDSVEEQSAWARFRATQDELQEIATEVLGANHGVALCCKCTLTDSVTYMKRLDEEKARVDGLMCCNLVWSCPRCSVKVAARRTMELSEALNDSGLLPILTTFTLQHKNGDRLTVLLDDLIAAMRYQSQGGQAYRSRLKDDFHIVGYVSGLEIRYGQNGPHPHKHVLNLADCYHWEFDATAFKAYILERFGKYLEDLGYLVNEHTVNVKVGPPFVGDDVTSLERYMTKWSLEQEVTSGYGKDGKGSLSPFQLLAEYQRTGDETYKLLFQEYEAATKGKKQLVKSRGLLKYLKERRKHKTAQADEDVPQAAEQSDRDKWREYAETLFNEEPGPIVEDDQPAEEPLLTLTQIEWRRVVNLRLRAAALAVAAKGDREKLISFFYAHGVFVDSRPNGAKPYENT